MPLRTTALVLAFAVVGATLLVLHGTFRRADPPKGPWRELIIVAPHPEDDVIVGADLASVVLRSGGKVRVLYVFDGSNPADPARAQRRVADVKRAWALAALPASALHFFNLPASGDLDGPSRTALERAPEVRRELVQVLKSAAQGALVLTLAEGEESQEHGFARTLTLEAYRLAERADLVLLESPLAHPFRSVVQAPLKAVPWVLGQIPGFQRLFASLLTRPVFPGFAWGPPGFALAPDPARQALRRQMLSSFSDGDAEELLRSFDYPARYRVVDQPGAEESAAYLGYVRLSTELVGVSVLLLACAVGVGAFALGAVLTRLIELALEKRVPSRVLRLISALLSLAMLASAALGLGGQPLRPYWLVALALGVWLSTTGSEEEHPPSHS